MTRLNENIPLTRPTEFPENEKGHVPNKPDPEPSSSDLSSKKSLSESSSKKKKRNKKKNVVKTGKMTCQTHLRAKTREYNIVNPIHPCSIIKM